ncbi:MAG: tRNA pseudouridine(38-40) synthase TruA [SAR86 cluster bacterium]|jgi:tRNA pseudouridine38-40 synthase|nr:tRNA pseudouridine(38-40) synthase TruA [Gammaproteobacteria bacterium]MDO7578427.1 tRNA pseudouridine(38-40) synthase TruA [SAR86 cluster bacterium]MDP0560053.1 tRNA pseudouridine(38-40) synthase TruA [Candidatus Thioglobus sp.]MBT4245321.1 tRNA pseudouridine(38-40) synthase TruA [Gammaproteobacteria bacterium]MBT4587605.1 tRNA pseudouridine(38-40) synthase TruA [Gammaproteobacteria bacterium]
MKIALGVEYLGTDFHGWQIQKSGLRTVQGVVEPALSKIANHPVRVFCSGRTDAGVHAQEQVIHFETQTTRTEGAWLFGGNANLPSDVNFKWAKEVNDDFHARFNAHARSYEYKIHHHPVRSSLKTGYYLWEPRSLNIDDMRKAAAFLVGEHDFSCFRGSMCQAKSPIKTIEYLQIDEIDDDLIIKVKANAFLHHMVRNLVGTLLKIGREEESPEWMLSVLNSKDRKQAGPTAEPQGLYFIKAYYQTL